MARSYFYLLDGLNVERGQRLKKALEQLDEISGIIVRADHGIIEVQSSRDPESQVKMACAIVGTTFRVKVNKRSLY
jgi:hypothetical protein